MIDVGSAKFTSVWITVISLEIPQSFSILIYAKPESPQSFPKEFLIIQWVEVYPTISNAKSNWEEFSILTQSSIIPVDPT